MKSRKTIMIAAVAVWNYQRAHIAMPVAPPTEATSQSAQPDRIFSALGSDQMRSQQSDHIFRGGFMPDRIFRNSEG